MIGTPPPDLEYPTGAARARAGLRATARSVTDTGIARMVEIVAAVREAVGWETSLCIDHFGHGYMTAKEVIRLGKALEPYGLAWMEDPMPLVGRGGPQAGDRRDPRADRRRRGALSVGRLPRA